MSKSVGGHVLDDRRRRLAILLVQGATFLVALAIGKTAAQLIARFLEWGGSQTRRTITGCGGSVGHNRFLGNSAFAVSPTPALWGPTVFQTL